MTGKHSKPASPDPGRAARFPRGHCGRPGCRCTHTEGCDYGWMEGGEPYTQRGVVYAAPVEPCPACRPEAATRMLADSTTPRGPIPDEALPAESLPPELWGDQL